MTLLSIYEIAYNTHLFHRFCFVPREGRAADRDGVPCSLQMTLLHRIYRFFFWLASIFS